MSDKETIDEFIKNRQFENNKITFDFLERWIELDRQLIELREDMKALKQDGKDEGVEAAKVIKAYNTLKRELATDPIKKADADQMVNSLSSVREIYEKIQDIVRIGK